MSRLLMKFALVVIPTAIIVFFMPRSNEFTYMYEVNKPWLYGDLYSSFKFGVMKNDSVLTAEREATKADFRPYYVLAKPSLDKKLDSLEQVTTKNWQGQDLDKHIKYIGSLLDSVYSKGILSETERDHLVDEKHHKGIRIITSNMATPVEIDDVFTTHSAYEYIMSRNSAKYPREVLQQFNIHNLIEPNLSYDENKSTEELGGLLDALNSTGEFVVPGEKIVSRGDIVTHDIYEKLQSYEKEFIRRQNDHSEKYYSIVGTTVLVAIIMIILVSYVSLFRADYFDNARSGLLLFGLPIFFCVMAALMKSHNFLNVFLPPYCMMAIIIRVFMDSRTAFMFHCAAVLIVSLMLTHSFEFLVLQFTTGMIAIQSLRVLTERSQIIRTAFLIFLAYVAVYIAFCLLRENDWKVESSMFIWFTINGILLLFTYPLLWLLEKGLGFVSDVTLVELSNISNPILQRMSEIAPGTFQHSMQVSNLSAEVANKIEARPLLVRTAALYHDIGKIDRAVFFTENQNGISPHKHLTPQKSAEVIIDHVNKGVALAEKHHIPESIKAFIRSHHGKGKAKYFYIQYKNEHPDEEIDESVFTYPGPNPSSKEEAILMMCDGCEAASRSLTEYTEESISTLVDRIIDGQVNDGFFSECDISFKDIAIAKSVLKEKLKTIYHTRISYPELTGNKETTEKKEDE